MPPHYLQDPLAAVERGVGWRWMDLPIALIDTASEGWLVALIALALFAWLEREVKDVVKVFLPLGLGLSVVWTLANLVRILGALPRPVSGAGRGLALLVGHALPTGQVASVVLLAGYALLVYGRRARLTLLLVGAVAAARVMVGAHWAADLAGGGAVGLALAAAVYALAVRLAPEGHIARLRTGRRAITEGPPSA